MKPYNPKLKYSASSIGVIIDHDSPNAVIFCGGDYTGDLPEYIIDTQSDYYDVIFNALVNGKLDYAKGMVYVIHKMILDTKQVELPNFGIVVDGKITASGFGTHKAEVNAQITLQDPPSHFANSAEELHKWYAAERTRIETLITIEQFRNQPKLNLVHEQLNAIMNNLQSTDAAVSALAGKVTAIESTL